MRNGRCAVNIAIYPRKGTETLIKMKKIDCIVIAIYPRKGTETFVSFCVHDIAFIAIYPRKGTETFSIGFLLQVDEDCNLSP